MSVTVPGWVLWLIPLCVGGWMASDPPQGGIIQVPTGRSCAGMVVVLVTVVAWIAFSVGRWSLHR